MAHPVPAYVVVTPWVEYIFDFSISTVAAKQHERQPQKRGRPRKAQLNDVENDAPRRIITRRRGRQRKQEKENQATEVTLEEGDVVSCDADQGESDHIVNNDVDNSQSHDMQPTEQEMVAKDAKGKYFVRYGIVILLSFFLAFFGMKVFIVQCQS